VTISTVHRHLSARLVRLPQSHAVLLRHILALGKKLDVRDDLNTTMYRKYKRRRRMCRN
jgi:hypothetical protein